MRGSSGPYPCTELGFQSATKNKVSQESVRINIFINIQCLKNVYSSKPSNVRFICTCPLLSVASDNAIVI